jgi:hypothetical protein
MTPRGFLLAVSLVVLSDFPVDSLGVDVAAATGESFSKENAGMSIPSLPS